jgi:ubiquitin C-terminal hydrolase
MYDYGQNYGQNYDVVSKDSSLGSFFGVDQEIDLGYTEPNDEYFEIPNFQNEQNQEEENETLPLGATGQSNLGNTCYQNAIVQGLSNCLNFFEIIIENFDENYKLVIENFFKNNNPKNIEEVYSNIEDNTIMFSLYKTIQALWAEDNEIKYTPLHEDIAPISLRKAIIHNFKCFNNFHQHDAEEFLLCILNKLDEELCYPIVYIEINDVKYTQLYLNYNNSNPEGKKLLMDSLSNDDKNKFKNILSYINFNKNYSLIQENFQFMLKSTISCTHCDNKSYPSESGLILELEIPDIQKDDSTILNNYYTNTYTNTYGYYNRNNIYTGLVDNSSEEEKEEKNENEETSEDTENNSEGQNEEEEEEEEEEDEELNIHTCLKKYFGNEKLTDENKWFCEKCNKHVIANKQMKLGRLGNVLIIQFKRFKQSGNTFVKNQEEIDFPYEINMKNYTDQDDDSIYELSSIINHEGYNSTSGHYTTYAKNRFNDTWYYYNDERVSEVEKLEEMFDDDAYILIYEKKDE